MTKRLDELMLTHIRDAGLPEPTREHKFDLDRKWRFDFAWPGQQLALEVEGGTWSEGRHVRAKGYQDDCQKYNAAAIAGWLVLRVTGGMVRSGEAIETLRKAMRMLNWESDWEFPDRQEKRELADKAMAKLLRKQN